MDLAGQIQWRQGDFCGSQGSQGYTVMWSALPQNKHAWSPVTSLGPGLVLALLQSLLKC